MISEVDYRREFTPADAIVWTDDEHLDDQFYYYGQVVNSLQKRVLAIGFERNNKAGVFYFWPEMETVKKIKMPSLENRLRKREKHFEEKAAKGEGLLAARDGHFARRLECIRRKLRYSGSSSFVNLFDLVGFFEETSLGEDNPAFMIPTGVYVVEAAYNMRKNRAFTAIKTNPRLPAKSLSHLLSSLYPEGFANIPSSIEDDVLQEGAFEYVLSLDKSRTADKRSIYLPPGQLGTYLVYEVPKEHLKKVENPINLNVSLSADKV